MSDTKPPPYLKVVGKALDVLPHESSRIERGRQLSLFLDTPARLFLVDMACISQTTFVSVVQQYSPALVFDTRPVPSFDFGSFSRRSAFRLFQERQVTYYDLGARLGINTYKDSSVASGVVAEFVGAVLTSLLAVPRSIGFLMEQDQAQAWMDKRVYDMITPRPHAGWALDIFPKPRLVSVPK